MTKKAWVTIGLPFCSKEVWARALASSRVRTLSKFLIANELRLEYGLPSHFYFWPEGAFEVLAQRWQEQLEFFVYKKYDIICADENLDQTSRVSLAKYLQEEGYEVKYVFFDVSSEVAKKRNESQEFLYTPQDEFEKLVLAFWQTRCQLKKEAEELGVELVMIKIENARKLLEQGVHLKSGDTVEETDYQIYVDCLEKEGLAFAPAHERWLGVTLTHNQRPTFLRLQ